MAKIMLVTGAARGIGAATARMAGLRGYAVAVNYSASREAAERVAADIRAGGGRAVTVEADVADPAAVAAMFEQVDRELGRLDVLVNNAGILKPMMRFEDMAPERMQRVLAVNVLGTFYCAQQAIRRMSTRYGGSGGAIVCISSIAALHGGPNDNVDYAASKAAVDIMLCGVGKQVAAEGIRINAIRPGIVRSDIHASVGEPDRMERMGPMVPMKRGGEAEEVAEAVLWLASDAASYCTGATLDVHGGRSL